MSRRPEEQMVVESFARFLTRTTERTWVPSTDEVLTRRNDPHSRKYDCEFTAERDRPIAADVFRLYPLGSYQKLQGDRHKIVNKLMAEGVPPCLYFETPFPEKKHLSPKWFQETARAFREAATSDPAAEVYEFNGVQARRFGESTDPSVFGHQWVS